MYSFAVFAFACISFAYGAGYKDYHTVDQYHGYDGPGYKHVDEYAGYADKGYKHVDEYAGYVDKGHRKQQGYGHDHIYVPKYECRSDSDCGGYQVCSGGYCTKKCGPCEEYHDIVGCESQCTRSAVCSNNECICPRCPGMSGYDYNWDCKPPKYLRGLCEHGHKSGRKDCHGYGCPGYQPKKTRRNDGKRH